MRKRIRLDSSVISSKLINNESYCEDYDDELEENLDEE